MIRPNLGCEKTIGVHGGVLHSSCLGQPGERSVQVLSVQWASYLNCFIFICHLSAS